MLRFILRRVISGVVLVVLISIVAYALLYLGGGDIARRILGVTASQETVDLRAAELGLNQPLWSQYINWLGGAVTGDLGTSWFTGQGVTAAITSRLAVTLSIVLGATIISAVVAVAIGVWAAVRRGWVDRVVQVVSVLGFAIPGFLIALALVTV
ncbi:MAG: transporter permease, partial [Glaciihabitans sp.]|nr:transporter permease [Glaciihabitans sp.]